MDASTGSPLEVSPGRLAVFGAAAGMGRWLAEKLLAATPWAQVDLVDVTGTAEELRAVARAFTGPVHLHEAAEGEPARSVDTGGLLHLGDAPTLIVLAVPLENLAGICRRLPPDVTRTCSVVVVADHMVQSLGAVTAVLGTGNVIGVHPLFERTATSTYGQIVYVVPPERSDARHVKITDLIRDAGAVTTLGTAAAHDRAMKYVQAAAHQSLVNFADVLASSGLDLREDLWAARTPLFETLLGLAARVLDPRQQATIDRIGSSADAADISARLTAVAIASEAVVTAGEYSARIESIREQFTGTLFDTAQNVAAIAVNAVQSTRTELARHLATQELVGVRLTRKVGALHVGRIVEVGTTDVLLDDLYLPGSGRGGVLLDGPGVHNQNRVGANGTAVRIRLSIGHIELLTGAALDAELDTRLAFIRRDIRFLVPESVSGEGVLRAVLGVGGTRRHALISEVVRTGQRSVVIRLEIRADHDLDETVERLRVLVQEVYRWPRGLSRPVNAEAARVLYLGPAGTFSEVAARQCAASARVAGVEFVAETSFDDVLAHLDGRSVAVIPVSSSSSGLVTRAVRALLATPVELAIGGVVDVSVRIDSYIRSDRTLEELRGARLYSHPQAIAQCSAFIARWQLEAVTCASTAQALQIVSGAGEPAVALASADADLTGLALKVGEREVDDLSGSITRFLVVGQGGIFADFSPEFTPTMRALWLGSGQVPPQCLAPGSASFDEILSDDSGNFLWITSRALTAEAVPSLRLLGRAPWSPRTPVVRVTAG